MLLLLFLAAGLLVGFARGGRLSNFSRLPLRHAWLALLALASQIAAFSPLAQLTSDLSAPIYLASNAILILAVVINLRLGGMRLLGVGLLCNALVIGLNGGYMPVSSASQRLAGLEHWAERLEEQGRYSNTVLMTEDTRLPVLGDVIPWPWPIPFRNVYSVGDFLIGLGGFWLVVRGMGEKPPASASAGQLPFSS